MCVRVCVRACLRACVCVRVMYVCVRVRGVRMRVMTSNPYLNNALSMHLFAAPLESLEFRRLRNKNTCDINSYRTRYTHFVMVTHICCENNFGGINTHFTIQL